jgi:hypothetical protein
MFQRVRIAGRVLPGNLRNIHSQDLSSFLYASKRCSSRSDHRLCLLVLERPCSPSLEHSLSSLLDSESLIDGLLLRNARAPTSTALPSWGRVRVALTSRPTFVVVDKVVPPKVGRDEVRRLKPVKRNECCFIGFRIWTSSWRETCGSWPRLGASFCGFQKL